MRYLPVSLQLSAAPVLLVGGGTVAGRKATLLLRAGADLTVVAPEIDPQLHEMLTSHGGTWLQSCYKTEHLDGMRLVVAATPDKQVNRQVSFDAEQRYLPVNVVDDPALCRFIFPAIVDRDPLTIAISSSGTSPVLARLLRRRIEAWVPAAFGRLAEFAGRFREDVKRSLPDETQRRRFWEAALESPIASDVLSGREEQAESRFIEALASHQASADQAVGEVYLLGAGPGDPDLMTFKAARLLQAADVVLYDRLVSSDIVDMARRDAQRIYVGKRRAEHTLQQVEINQLLLELAQQGKRVARLKGGDPFVFGRGGEELELLTEHQIPFQIVPGVSAGNGVACYAGIPLTHRDHAHSVRFVAAYLKEGVTTSDWEQFRSPEETLVFYMGLVGLADICRELQAIGRAADTPIALIERGTLPEQRVLTGTLATMPELVAQEAPKAPTLIIVGDVVGLQPRLQWFGTQAVAAATPH